MRKYKPLQIILTITVLLTAFIRFYPNHLELPVGCDEFGYLNMSKAISGGRVFDHHVNRTFMPELVEDLNSSGFEYRDYAWIIAPHAYHLHEETNLIINQYPPGTSLLMSLIPIQFRQLFFPLVVLLILIIVGRKSITSLNVNSESKDFLFTLLMIFILYAITSSPMLKEFTAVNSVAPTLGLLLGAGILLHERPMWSVFLIALSVNFRLANAVLLPFPMIYAWFKIDQLEIFGFLRRGLKILLLVLVSGTLLYAVHTTFLLGTPFEITYSSIDRSFTDLDGFVDNLAYYFSLKSGWFILNLLSLSSLIILRWRGLLGGKILACAGGLTFLSYLYFLIHQAKTPYYPYGSAVIMIGIVFYHLSRNLSIPTKFIRSSQSLILGLFLIILFNSYQKFKNSNENAFDDQVSAYSGAFSEYDVVWGELKTGTVEYAASVPTMRYIWGTDDVRAFVMRWLMEHGYKQAVLINDLPLSEEELGNYFFFFSINGQLKEDEDFGPLIIIEPEENE